MLSEEIAEMLISTSWQKEAIMNDKFTCNSCEKEMDVGYFYCPECHELHKKKRNGSDDQESIPQEPGADHKS